MPIAKRRSKPRVRSNPWRWAALGGVLLAVLGIGIWLSVVGPRDGSAPTRTTLDARQPAPLARLPTTDGFFDLASLQGRPVVLFFTFVG